MELGLGQGRPSPFRWPTHDTPLCLWQGPKSAQRPPIAMLPATAQPLLDNPHTRGRGEISQWSMRAPEVNNILQFGQ